MVDLLGYGKSSKPQAPFMLTDQADAVAELLRHLAIPRYTLVGHSMGGQIAMHLAHRHPEQVQRLVLLAPAGIERFTAEQVGVFELMQPAAVMAADADIILQNLQSNFHQFPEEARFMARDREKIKADPQFPLYAQAVVYGVKGMVREPVWEWIPKLQQEVLIIYGEEDALIPNRFFNPGLTITELLAEAKERFPRAQTVALPAAGHFIMWEKAEEVNQRIRSFCLE
ncbi:alpha/beta hydrolase fold protein [Nitritalea halalkaliphila LW7]|uniref:Alpha/beta hydrolase fold protein n=1 Tax=Nitritalea halalkaliphila LW7 TaxID=1189621 RepID=I5C8C1_9BACT|nr:alpha/beta hydrolase fold protein [Nitritalea halalkaliphila LW7]